MSDPHMTQKLAEAFANIHEMTADQARLLQAYVTKTVEAKEAEEAFLEMIEDVDGGDMATADAINDAREILLDTAFRLSGNDCVLLACLIKELEGNDHTDTKKINILLQSLKRKPSNATKIVDGLEKKGLVEIDSEGLHSHKSYRLTGRGRDATWALINGQQGNDRIAVVK